MKNEQEEAFNILENAEKTNKEDYSQDQWEKSNQERQVLINEAIEGTPFRVVGNQQAGFKLVIGKYALTDPKGTISEIREVLKSVDWNILANMVVILNRAYREVEENEKEKDKGSQLEMDI